MPTETMEDTESLFSSIGFIIFFLVIFAVLSSVALMTVAAVIVRELSPPEVGVDIELAEQRRAVIQPQVTAWLTETGAGEPLPLYTVKGLHPLGGPPAYEDCVAESDLWVFIIGEDEE
jgi:hypothetical protein